ncbi:MAG: LysR family transcriptional regulator [Bacteroidales bacterium]|nr:LysR family transcriptional regulator [Bacteroidales bacterium]
MKPFKKEKKNSFFLNYKIWLSNVSGDGVIDEMKYRLLTLIDEKGSLKAATKEIGISYRKAWGDLKRAEEVLGYQLTEKQRGGLKGGRSIITERGKKLLEAYDAFHQKFDDSIEEAFDEFNNRIKND